MTTGVLDGFSAGQSLTRTAPHIQAHFREQGKLFSLLGLLQLVRLVGTTWRAPCVRAENGT